MQDKARQDLPSDTTRLKGDEVLFGGGQIALQKASDVSELIGGVHFANVDKMIVMREWLVTQRDIEKSSQ